MSLRILSRFYESTTVVSKASTWRPIAGQPVRFKTISEKLPDQPSYEKKLLFATCEPIYPRDTRPSSETCGKLVAKEKEIHPYVRILADELTEYLERSPLIFLYHSQSTRNRVWRNSYNYLYNKGIILKRYDHDIVELALNSTKWAPLLRYYSRTAWTGIAFAESIIISPAFEVEKNFPFLSLMFGVYQDRVLGRDELLKLMKLPDRNYVNYELTQILNRPSASLTRSLSHPSQNLSSILQQWNTDRSPNYHTTNKNRPYNSKVITGIKRDYHTSCVHRSSNASSSSEDLSGSKPQEDENTFENLLRNSPFMSLGDFEGRILVGTIYNVFEDDLYIDFGGKFHCVCRKPRDGT